MLRVHFVLADAGNLSAPCKLKSRFYACVAVCRPDGPLAMICSCSVENSAFIVQLSVAVLIMVTSCYFFWPF